MQSVLIVESDERLLRERAHQLSLDGYEVQTAQAERQARLSSPRSPTRSCCATPGGGPRTLRCCESCAPGRSRALTRACPCSPWAPMTTPRRYVCTATARMSRYPTRSSPLLVTAGLEALARRLDVEQQRRRCGGSGA